MSGDSDQDEELNDVSVGLRMDRQVPPFSDTKQESRSSLNVVGYNNPQNTTQTTTAIVTFPPTPSPNYSDVTQDMPTPSTGTSSPASNVKVVRISAL